MRGGGWAGLQSRPKWRDKVTDQKIGDAGIPFFEWGSTWTFLRQEGTSLGVSSVIAVLDYFDGAWMNRNFTPQQWNHNGNGGPRQTTM